MIGGKGNDIIDGGTPSDPDFSLDPNFSSPDYAYYTGSPDEYDRFVLGGTPGLLPIIQVVDKVPNRDGIDTLFIVEVLLFGSGDALALAPIPENGGSAFASGSPLLDSQITAFSSNYSGITSALIPT